MAFNLGYTPAVATSIVYQPNDTPMSWRRLGRYGFTGTATLPANNIGCIVSNVGYIDANSLIFISDTNAGQDLIECKYDGSMNLTRTTGDNGSFIVGSEVAMAPTVDQTFQFMVVNL